MLHKKRILIFSCTFTLKSWTTSWALTNLGLSRKLLLLLFFISSLVETHLNYMIAIWGSASDSLIKPLQVIQNRALRNVFNLDRLLNRNEMYRDMVDDNLPIRGLFYANVAGFVYKARKNLMFCNVTFDRGTRRTGRRNNIYLRPDLSRTMYGSRAITAIGPRIFNDLPEDIQKSHHFGVFKRAVKAHLRQEEMLQSCFNGDFLSKFT